MLLQNLFFRSKFKNNRLNLGKAEIERALEEQGLEWKDINILQNWNDADGMVFFYFLTKCSTIST